MLKKETFLTLQEDTPSYHRRYDFLVKKFSSLCKSEHPVLKTRDDLRIAGIQGGGYAQ